MITPSLHGKPRHPYYIFGPDYRETSSGICVLHYLCHALNLAGYEAYLSNCQVNPNLRTPILTDEVRRHHQAIGLAPIAVYPEVVDANPFAAPIVARYILNREGFLTGRAIDAQESDLFFYYTQDFRGDGKSTNLLLLPVIDSELFSPPLEPVQRSGNYLYLNRIDRAKVDYSLLPDDIEVLSLANPKTLAELAQIFRSAETLYSYEISATCTEAMLCGCPVIYMPGGHVKTQPFTEQFGDAGSALYDEPGGLERARATVMQARMRWLDIERAFWPQLERFLEITQQAASQHIVDNRIPSLKEWLQHRVLTPIQQQLVDQRRQQLHGQASLTLLVRDPLGDAAALSDTLESLALWQSASSIRLRTVILSTSPGPASLSGSLLWLTCEPGAIELNEILQADDNEWFMLLTAGDEMLPAGTLMLDLELASADGCRMLYCDGMLRSADGPSAVLRPCANLDYLLSLPLAMASHWLVRRELALQVGGYDPQLPQALELDLILRLIEVAGMSGIAHLDEPLVVSNTPTLADNPDEHRALLRHLGNRGYDNAEVLQEPPRHYHIKYGHEQQPLVSILIPSRDQLPLLQRCVESLLAKTSYPHFEIILVDNDSQSPQTLAWLNEMASIGGEKLRVIHYPHPFNASAINNLAASQARGEYLVLLNNETAVLREDWLEQLLNHAQRPEVGVVGAKLISPAATIQHAGLISGLHGPAGSPFIDQPANASGYLQRLQVDQNISAASAACLMIGTALYHEAGGMDAELFQVTCNDLDLCLKVANLGYLNVWTPHAVMLHEGGASWAEAQKNPQNRQRFALDQQQAYCKWLSVLANDPAYNKNLSLQGNGFEFEAVHGLTWKPLSWRPLPVVLAHPLQAADAARERVLEPFELMRSAGLIDGCLSSRVLSPVALERFQPDVVVFQRLTDLQRLNQMQQVQQFSAAFKVLEVDCFVPALAGLEASDEQLGWDALRQAASHVDRIIVPTQRLADTLEGLHRDIRVVETRLGEQWRHLPQPVRLAGKPRIGCAFEHRQADSQHLLEGLIRQLAEQVDWVLWGDVPASLRPFARELHEGDLQTKPAVLASLNLDIALAVLGNSIFDQCRSALQLLQLGACGYTVICSDVAAFHGDYSVTRAGNNEDDWLKALHQHLDDPEMSRRQGIELRQQVFERGMLDAAHMLTWRNAWLPA
ncbi:glycosyltransferase family 2 protein [Pseudomonas sp.]|uniref:glycosyltransferase family 2 protein n=1 Tax=Pseudomonas sp. TaxID=306 RepID=UPI003D6DD17B